MNFEDFLLDFKRRFDEQLADDAWEAFAEDMNRFEKFSKKQLDYDPPQLVKCGMPTIWWCLYCYHAIKDPTGHYVKARCSNCGHWMAHEKSQRQKAVV